MIYIYKCLNICLTFSLLVKCKLTFKLKLLEFYVWHFHTWSNVNFYFSRELCNSHIMWVSQISESLFHEYQTFVIYQFSLELSIRASVNSAELIKILFYVFKLCHLALLEYLNVYVSWKCRFRMVTSAAILF